MKKDGTFGVARRALYGDWELLASSASETEVLQGNAESPSSSDLNATGAIGDANAG